MQMTIDINVESLATTMDVGSGGQEGTVPSPGFSYMVQI